MTTTLYPEYKNAGEIIAKLEHEYFTIEEMADILKSPKESNEFKFKVLKLKDYLLNTHGIDLLSVNDEDDGKGYKIATCSESLKITVSRLARRVRNAAFRQRTVLETIDRTQLIGDETKVYDRNMVKNGLLISFMNKTRRMQLPQSSVIRIDVPKVIDIEP